MTPGFPRVEPETTNAEKQAFREGYEAGRASIRRELKDLIATLDSKEAYVASTSTFIN